jgi:DNA replication protein DnaC
MIQAQIPEPYWMMEFEDYIAYTPHLAEVRSKIAAWAKAQVLGQRDAGSVYLYSAPGKHGSGCGNGKSMLANAAFKYIARRRAILRDLTNHKLGYCDKLDIDLFAFACDLKRFLIDPAARAFKEHTDLNIDVFALTGHDLVDLHSPDDYVRVLGSQPDILFLDDVGRGVQPGKMGAQLYEDLFNERVIHGLPVFVTTNYSPDQLAEQIGHRAVSRILRNNNCEVIEVQAPDFATIKHRLRRN